MNYPNLLKYQKFPPSVDGSYPENELSQTTSAHRLTFVVTKMIKSTDR